jgi:hypothetical protein
VAWRTNNIFVALHVFFSSLSYPMYANTLTIIGTLGYLTCPAYQWQRYDFATAEERAFQQVSKKFKSKSQQKINVSRPIFIRRLTLLFFEKLFYFTKKTIVVFFPASLVMVAW